MPYYINRTDGTSLITVQDGVTDNTVTSIILVGKNFPTYGQILNQNLVSMLENFANTAEPDNSLIGQLWYDSGEKALKIYREGSVENQWKKIAVTAESSEEPVDARAGDLWWDTNSSQLKIYDAAQLEWRIIGPQTTNTGQLRVSGNSFDIQVSGNSYFNIDQFGGITLNRNPCVYAYNNIAEANLTTASTSIYTTWVPDEVAVDRSEGFDANTGVFTVKTSGLYRVQAVVSTLGGANAPGANEMRLRWQKNSSDSNINSTVNHTSDSVGQMVCEGIISATVGDTIRLVYSTDLDAYISSFNATYSIQMIG